MKRMIHRAILAGLTAAFVGTLVVGGNGLLDAAHAWQRNSNDSTASSQTEQRPRLLREGMKISNKIGKFRNDGDSATFVTEDGLELGGLPNLGLERVMNTLKAVEDPAGVWWSVNGIVTEYSGRNYVLISRAVYKSASPPPPPETVGAVEQ